MTPTLYLIARLLLGGAFVVFGIRNFGNIPKLTATLTAKRLPRPRELAIAGVLLQIIGGALSAVGPWPALGGILMIVFLILATVLFHPMWEYSGEARYPHTSATLINTSLVGAFLLLIASAV